MRTAQKYMWLIALIALVAACQSPKQVLLKSESRSEIINSIASDHEMSKETMDAIMRGEHGKMLMHDRMNTMMKDKSGMAQMMKDDPEMKNRMTSTMMENAKADTAMMAQMHTSMMNNPEMKKRMMSTMMENAKRDTVMMAQMCKSMMNTPKMMDMMEKMKEEKDTSKLD